MNEPKYLSVARRLRTGIQNGTYENGQKLPSENELVAQTGYSRQNTYEVSEPEAGDLVYYYDAAGNYTHVATYLGNGLVLNGNYSDGRAHITSMYESMYAQNPMVFLRVER